MYLITLLVFHSITLRKSQIMETMSNITKLLRYKGYLFSYIFHRVTLRNTILGFYCVIEYAIDEDKSIFTYLIMRDASQSINFKSSCSAFN